MPEIAQNAKKSVSLEIALNSFHTTGILLLMLIATVSLVLLYSRIRLIARKNGLLREERNKYKKLLFSLLPDNVALEIIQTGHVEAKRHDKVCILFTDFVGFTSYSETVKPMELVKHLDEIFSMFDSIILHANIEKIKTIGDSYMCVAGLQHEDRNPAEEMLRVALEFREYIRLFRRLKKLEGVDFPDIRIGIHSGPVVAGVIGVTKTAYDVWGDSVNVAQRMETNSEPGKINVSEAVYLQLPANKFRIEPRGLVEIKGKGPMNMYFVEAETA